MKRIIQRRPHTDERPSLCDPHFSFPKQVWAELREQGRVVPHPVFPDKAGPAARAIENEADVRDVIELLRLNYDRAVARYGLPEEG